MSSVQTRGKRVLFLCIILLPLFVVTHAFAQQYQVTAIEPPAGYTASRAMGINNLGQVVGRFYNVDGEGNAVDRQAFVWDRTNGPVLLPTFSGESSAWAVNDTGFVSGYSYTVEGKQHAAVWDSDRNIYDIGTLMNGIGVSGDESTAYGINRYGEVVGNADIPNDAGDFMPFHAFYYNETDGIFDLGTFTSDWPAYQNGYSIAYDINVHSEIVGIAHDSSWAFLPFIWDKTNGMLVLQRDPSYENGEWYAVAISDKGLIGGHVITATNQSLPYYWPDKSSPPVRITMPSGFPYGEVYGINKSGEMVGIMWSSDQADAVEHAFLFSQKAGVTDLNDLLPPGSGWALSFARDINDKGQVVGYGDKSGQKRGFVLNPATGIAADFGPLGLYYFPNGSVFKLSSLDPEGMQYVAGVLYVDFGSNGLYAYDGGGWAKISASNPENMIGAGTDLYVDFGFGVGLYKYSGAEWTKLTGQDPENMIASDTGLYVDFGEGTGLYRHNGEWQKISALDPLKMCLVGADLYVDFGAEVGLYKYDGAKWAPVNKRSPQAMWAMATDLYADFGAGVGLYKYDGSAWDRIHKLSPEDICLVGADLCVDFGTEVGLYKYDGAKWSRLSKLSPEGMCAVETNLYAYFAEGVGLYKYDGSIWSRLSKAAPEAICAARLN